MLVTLVLTTMLSIAAESAPFSRPHLTPKNGISLSEAYQTAVKRSETVGIQSQLLVQADELEKQARALFLPSLQGSATFLRQDAPTSATAKEQNTVKITGTQSLFRGFHDLALLHQRSALDELQKAALRDAQRQLFYDVADAYFGTLTLLADERNFGNELEVNQRRLKDLENFRKIGRSRTSEVLSQKANIASLGAQLESTRGQLKIQREVLAFLTGLGADVELREIEGEPKQNLKVEDFLGAVEQRPDVLAAKASVEGASEAVGAAKGFHWPTADINGNYYLDRPSYSTAAKWDVSLVLGLSLFQGGAIQSQVRQAVSVKEQAELTLSRTERLADQEVRRFFDSVASGQKQLLKLDEFADLSKQNYEAQQRDYSHGLVTNLDVLQSISSWQVAIRTRERAQLALKDSYAKLQAAGGKRAELMVSPE